MGKKKILVIDDEKECCAFFEDYLPGRDHLIDTENADLFTVSCRFS